MPSEPLTMVWLEEATLWPREKLEELVDAIQAKGQVVLAGPPGTGKTWVAKHVARFLTQAEKRVEIVQFHPSYGYEEFIEGLRPVVEEGGIDFQVAPGRIRKLAAVA